MLMVTPKHFTYFVSRGFLKPGDLLKIWNITFSVKVIRNQIVLIASLPSSYLWITSRFLPQKTFPIAIHRHNVLNPKTKKSDVDHSAELQREYTSYESSHIYDVFYSKNAAKIVDITLLCYALKIHKKKKINVFGLFVLR